MKVFGSSDSTYPDCASVKMRQIDFNLVETNLKGRDELATWGQSVDKITFYMSSAQVVPQIFITKGSNLRQWQLSILIPKILVSEFDY